MHVFRDYVALIEVLVAHIEHLRERQELGILMLASNLAHLVKIPFVLYVASDTESECSRIAVVEVVINLLEVSLRILVVDCGVYSSSLDDLFVDEVVTQVVAALCTDCTVLPQSMTGMSETDGIAPNLLLPSLILTCRFSTFSNAFS